MGRFSLEKSSDPSSLSITLPYISAKSEFPTFVLYSLAYTLRSISLDKTEFAQIVFV